MEDFEGNKHFARFLSFWFDPESRGHTLHVSDGGAGESTLTSGLLDNSVLFEHWHGAYHPDSSCVIFASKPSETAAAELEPGVSGTNSIQMLELLILPSIFLFSSFIIKQMKGEADCSCTGHSTTSVCGKCKTVWAWAEKTPTLNKGQKCTTVHYMTTLWWYFVMSLQEMPWLWPMRQKFSTFDKDQDIWPVGAICLCPCIW